MTTIGDIAQGRNRYRNGIVAGDRPDFGLPLTVGEMLNPQAGKTIGELYGSQVGMPEMQMPEAPQAPGKREVWRDVLGSVFDAMAMMGGQRGNYWGGVQREQDQYRDDMKDYQALQQQVNLAKYRGDIGLYEKAMEAAQGPKPTAMMQNDAFLRERYGPDFAKEYLMKPTFVQNWDGTRTQVGGGSALPPGYDPEEWEVVAGGAGGNVSGNFPR